MTDDTKHGVTAAESAQGANQGINTGINGGINWTRARDIPFSILGWAAVLFVAFWAAGHIIGTLLVLAIAALIAYALAPVIGILRRWLPWADGCPGRPHRRPRHRPRRCRRRERRSDCLRMR